MHLTCQCTLILTLLSYTRQKICINLFYWIRQPEGIGMFNGAQKTLRGG